MSDSLAEFTAFRQRMNERILAEDNQVVRRFFALDTQTYKAGALDVKTKEMLGLVASLVLRCDDCISYHVAQCKEAGVSAMRFSRCSASAWWWAARS
jgi:AhpD family alkylhydroperoxidase